MGLHSVKYEIDFLPPSCRQELEVRRAWRSRIALAVAVLAGLGVTEIIFRVRLARLEKSAILATAHARDVVHRSTRAAEFEARHIALVEELRGWTRPLQSERASRVLDAVLTSRPKGMYFNHLSWEQDVLGNESDDPVFILEGLANGVGLIPYFLKQVDRAGVLPPLELRQSDTHSVAGGDSSLQRFRIESPAKRSGGV